MKTFLIRSLFLGALSTCFVACEPDYKVETHLADELRDTVEIQIAAYVEKRHEYADTSLRFDPKIYYYYQRTVDNSYLHRYYLDPKTNQHYFLYVKREFRSLYEQDKRSVGGTFYLDDSLRITGMNQVFWTPMLRDPAVVELGEMLFDEMVSTGGNVDKYFGDPTKVEWPNKDLVYNPKTNDWIYQLDTLAHKLPEKKN